MSLAIAGAMLGGTILNAASTKSANDKNAKLQKEFAKNGVKWKVEDAKQAGIHPLAAMGMSPNQATPSYVGSDPGSPLKRVAEQYTRSKLNKIDPVSQSTANLNNAQAASIWEELNPTGDPNIPNKKQWTHTKRYDPRSGKWKWIPGSDITQALENTGSLAISADPSSTTMDALFRDAPPPQYRNYRR